MTPDIKKDSRQQEITDISRSLKMLAMELSVPVLALSQLSRDIEKRKTRPQLSDLRESGAIEQDADIVMFIHRPDLVNKEKPNDPTIKPNVAQICVEKHRNGGTGDADLYFMGAWTKFLNINSQTGEPEYGDEEVKTNNDDVALEKLNNEQNEGIEEPSQPKSVEDELYGN
jgi:replicative DNA helicase